MFEAGLGNNPIYAWRGIWEAKKWLKVGCKWRIGDGKFVKIWKDHWIPGQETLCTESEELREDETVDQLLNCQTRWWDVEKVSALFNPKIAEDILRIVKKIGSFNVKSAYNLFRDRSNDKSGECSSFSRHETLWKYVWKMPLPNKIKVFTWRACKEGLSTKLNLKKRRVKTKGSCCFCKKVMEDTSHALFICPDIRDYRKNYVPIVQTLDNKMRNKIVVERNCFYPKQAIDYALTVQSLFKGAKGFQNWKVKELYYWKPHVVGFLKLNVNGAMFFNRHKAGIGAVLRDDKGDVGLVWIRKGLQICANMRTQRLILESDSLLTVNEREASFSLLGNLVREVKKLKALLEVCLVQHVDRAGNEVAHKLARNA
ncbi:hypothetical protein F2P56_012246 [Juglans regia]|uniref:Uncharacterized protein LOC108987698 n=2 Tax=Juglans regia TaxID=51240 RepID=A0A2I4EA02_JUGRE|nr:uncharacterized protein LOC108987698 [Juglans regia]KAF5468064.1 hypothetical protein F2P56_012246 [Juglans regia]